MVGSFLEATGNWEWKGKERDLKPTFPVLIELKLEDSSNNLYHVCLMAGPSGLRA